MRTAAHITLDSFESDDTNSTNVILWKTTRSSSYLQSKVSGGINLNAFMLTSGAKFASFSVVITDTGLPSAIVKFILSSASRNCSTVTALVSSSIKDVSVPKFQVVVLNL